MRVFSKTISCLGISMLLLAGCAGTPSDNYNKEAMREQARVKSQQRNLDEIYYSLPSPLEVAQVVQTTGVGYEASFLHNVELGVRYSTNMASAVNLGIYGADLSYSLLFDQHQEALKYLDCVRKLSAGLDISDILTQKKLKTVEENISNKEMLKKIVSQTFLHSDALLKENSRRPTAAMIAMGMWVESLYISTRLSEGDPELNPALSTCIVEQGLVFNDLLGMLSTLESNADVAHLKEMLEPLNDSYKAMSGFLGGSYVVAKATGIKYDKQLFASICDNVLAVRTGLTDLF